MGGQFYYETVFINNLPKFLICVGEMGFKDEADVDMNWFHVDPFDELSKIWESASDSRLIALLE